MKVSILALASITTLAANAFGTIPFAAAEEEVRLGIILIDMIIISRIAFVRLSLYILT